MRKILIADDSSANLMLLAQILEQSGYEVVQANNGLEALNEVSLVTPDLMILDLHMPEMDGINVLVNMKKRNISIPVIVLSAVADDITYKHVFELGVHDFIKKPFDSNILLYKIEKVWKYQSVSNVVH